MTKTHRLLLALGLCVAMLIPASLMAPANASEGSSTKCVSNGNYSHYNDWSFFWSKKIRAYEHVCTRIGSGAAVNFPYLAYVRTPSITYPSRFPIPSGEKVTTTRSPYVSYRGYYSGKLTAVTYSWSAKSCSGPCTNWDFKLRVTTGYTQICVIGGSCDSRKYW